MDGPTAATKSGNADTNRVLGHSPGLSSAGEGAAHDCCPVIIQGAWGEASSVVVEKGVSNGSNCFTDILLVFCLVFYSGD